MKIAQKAMFEKETVERKWRPPAEHLSVRRAGQAIKFADTPVAVQQSMRKARKKAKKKPKDD